MSAVNNPIYEFGPFRLDSGEKLFFKHQELVPLTPKALDVLIFLVRNNGSLVEKDTLLSEVWPETFVSESSLTHHIHQIRKALNGDSEGQTYIETVPRRGYRFKADIRETDRSEPQFLDQSTSTDLVRTAQSAPLLDATSISRRRWKLRHLVYVGLVITILGASYVWLSQRSKPQAFRPTSAAILPFKPIGETNQQLGLGMADALILKLSNLDQLKILPTSSISRFVETDRDPVAIGRELGVDAVISGTVQEADGRVRVNAQVTNVNTGQPLWQAKFDEELTDVFTVQDAISERIAETFALKLTGDNRKQLAKKYTTKPDAYRSFLLGFYFWNKRTGDSLTKAIDNFQRAVELDPNYAIAYSYIADCYQLQVFYEPTMSETQRAEFMGKSKELAEKALSLDPTIPEPYLSLAAIKHYNLDDAGVEDLFKRAVSLAANNAMVHMRYAWFLFEYARMEEAIRELKIARDLDPLSAVNNAALATILLSVRQYDDAIKYGRQAIDLDTNVPRARVVLATAYTGKKLYSQAIAELKEIKGSPNDQKLALQELAYIYAVTGDAPNALRLLKHLETDFDISNTIDGPINQAATYMALGQRKLAFEWLDKLCTFKILRNRIAVQLNFDPQLDKLRSDPEFANILAKYPLPKVS